MDRFNFYKLMTLLVGSIIVIQAPKWTNSFIMRHYKLSLGIEAINLTQTKDPLKLFKMWRDEANTLSTLNPRPDVVTIATLGEDGPSTQIVMLRDISDTGFKFYVTTPVTKNLAQNNISFTVVWTFKKSEETFGMRYITVHGITEKIPVNETKELFKLETPTSKIRLILQSQKNDKKQNLSERLQPLLDMYNQNPKQFHKQEMPSEWSGYIIKPKTLEFFQGTKATLGQRIKFSKKSDVKNNSTNLLSDGACGGEKGWIFQVMEP